MCWSPSCVKWGLEEVKRLVMYREIGGKQNKYNGSLVSHCQRREIKYQREETERNPFSFGRLEFEVSF